MARFFSVIAILTFGSVVLAGGLTTKAQCVDSVIVKNTWASIGSIDVAVPVYAHLCTSDTITIFTFALQYDTSFLKATDIIYEVHDSAVPTFYDLYPNPAKEMRSMDPGGYIAYVVIFDFSADSGIIGPPEGRYSMFSLLFDVVARETGTTLLDVTASALGDKTPVLVDGIFNVTLSRVEGSFQPHTDPKLLALCQNYPNPFNPTTEIRYVLPRDCKVRLDVHNVAGQKVATLVDGKQKAGYKTARWDAGSFSSGIYFYRLQAGGFVQTRKMVLIR